ncbi:hypothetical protein COCON_G00126400 [Conger conger]|uniref:AIG1-type G domain-containing protein n=1 Tax=Conger conger TaxID=82655 RepID=A0A9Q1DD25_CONCO|nr:hypothetical protein COCON_G00126400 [Conger conger]
MADSTETHARYSTTKKEYSSNWLDIIKASEQKATEPIEKYLVSTVKQVLDEDGRVRRYTFGRKDLKKRNRTILMMGETGTGKSTMINRMLNYMLGVKWEDNIRFEIIPDEDKIDETASKTIVMTVYEIFGLEEVPFSLTVIDTPGFHDSTGHEKDKITTQNLYKVFKSLNNMEQIDAACLVVNASENVLTSGQIYIFDTILSLLGKNMEKNIVTLFTFSQWMPPSALKAVIKSGIPVPKDNNDEHVYFEFNNLPVEMPAKKYEQTYKTAWDKGTKSFEEFFKALDLMETQSLRVMRKVVKQHQSLEDSIQRLESITDVEETSKALDQERKTLKKLEEDMKKPDNFKYKYNVLVMKRVEINGYATCCTVCQMNCHYPGCWWVNDLSWCSVMKGGKCTACPKNCSYVDHKKENKIYQPQNEERTGTNEAEETKAVDKISAAKGRISKLEQDLKDTEAKLMEQSYQCILKLREFALKFDSDSTHRNILKLIEMLKKNEETEKVKELQKMMEKNKETEKVAELQEMMEKSV